MVESQSCLSDILSILHDLEYKSFYIDNDRNVIYGFISGKVFSYRVNIRDVNPVYAIVAAEFSVQIPEGAANELKELANKQNCSIINGKFVVLKDRGNKTFVLVYRVPVIKEYISKEYFDKYIFSSMATAMRDAAPDVVTLAADINKNNAEDNSNIVS